MSAPSVDAFSPAPIPRLATARLLLREPRLADFEAFAANLADPLAAVPDAGAAEPRDVWRRFHTSAGHWLLHGTGAWTIEAPAVGAIGSVGIFRRETGPELEIGWVIHRPHWGRGYASEAARAALDFAVTAWHAERLIAHIAKRNEASLKVATKIGMQREGEVDFYGEIQWRYAFNRERDGAAPGPR